MLSRAGLGMAFAGALALPAAAPGAITFDDTTYPIDDGTGDFRPTTVGLADMDEQDGLDIVVTSRERNKVSVLLNNGGGTFDPAAHYTSGCGSSTFGLALDDFTGDGNVDAVVRCPVAGLAVLPGNGSGALGAADVDTGEGIANNLTLAELDGDAAPEVVYNGFGTGGAPDILCHNQYSSGTWTGPVCQGQEDPNPSNHVPWTPFGGDMQAADFNDSLRAQGLDEILGSRDTALISLAGRDPTAPFGGWTFGDRGTDQVGPQALMATDLQDDGDIDAVVAGPGPVPPGGSVNAGEIAVLLWGPNGIETTTPPKYGTIDYPWDGVAADFDGDGLNDVAITTGSMIGAAHHGNPDGSLAGPEQFMDRSTIGGTPTMAAGDLNGDGKDDVVLCEDADHTCITFLATGSAPPPDQDPGATGDPAGGTTDPTAGALPPPPAGGAPPGTGGTLPPNPVTPQVNGLRTALAVGRNGVLTLGTATNPPTASTQQTLTFTPGANARAAQRRRRPVVIARGRTNVPAGRTASVKARLTRQGKRLLRKRRTLRVRLRIVARSATGLPATVTRRVRVRRR